LFKQHQLECYGQHGVVSVHSTFSNCAGLVSLAHFGGVFESQAAGNDDAHSSTGLWAAVAVFLGERSDQHRKLT
jgi:hypothetical protein